MISLPVEPLKDGNPPKDGTPPMDGTPPKGGTLPQDRTHLRTVGKLKRALCILLECFLVNVGVCSTQGYKSGH